MAASMTANSAKDSNMTYLLTDKGRNITYAQWRKMGGCGISNYASVWTSNNLQVPPAGWDSLELGKIADACVVANRELARFALEHLKLTDFATEENRG